MNVPRHAFTRSVVADVPDAETQYHTHEFLDVTVQPKPIYISPNEVYAMHGLLAQHIDRLVRPSCCPLVYLMQALLRVLPAMTHCGQFFTNSMAYPNLAVKNLKMPEIEQLHWS